VWNHGSHFKDHSFVFVCVAVSGLITDISAVTLISACFMYSEFVLQ